jgi:hypothetical protein
MIYANCALNMVLFYALVLIQIALLEAKRCSSGIISAPLQKYGANKVP